ncbi:MAG: energy transducer TonB [Gammaproteobacteria bacterium]
MKDSGDRLALALCLAVLAHSGVILGVGFSKEDRSMPQSQSQSQSLEVILIQNRSPKASEEPDYLAQTNLQGGGDIEHKESPSTPLISPFPEQEPAIAAAGRPQQEHPVVEQVAKLAQAGTEIRGSDKGEAEKSSREQPDELMLEQTAAFDSSPEPEKRTARPEPVTQSVESRNAKSPSLPSAALLMQSALAMASLNAEIEQRLSIHAKAPRRKFISANTREYKYAAYMEAWRTKVERVGNLNYPDEARARKLAGSLILDVGLRSDGRVVEMTLRRSSGDPILDQAAMRIVELASPFSSFSDDIRSEVDVLHITRTWQFLYSQRFASE